MIYVLTTGEYSDYCIKGVFTDGALAKEAQNLVPDSSIEEYKPDVIPDHPPGRTAWQVYILDGTLEHCMKLDIWKYPFVPSEIPSEFYGKKAYNVRCWARDEEHAKKIALDKYYQWKYEREFGK